MTGTPLASDATILVTGGAGFIGSTLIRELLLARPNSKIVILDAFTYAGHEANLSGPASDPRVTIHRGRIQDHDTVRTVFQEHAPSAVLHLAAESHVDRSIDAPETFLDTNVQGTYTLLQAARQAWRERPDVRFVHVSTDEVFGSLNPEDAPFTETTRYDPRSPYSASKAAADHLARAWYATYHLPVIVTNCSNNYGPRQHPEKLIPTIILKRLRSEPIPVYGAGDHVRDWLHVRDHAHGLIAALTRGVPGATYLFGGRAERTNLELVHALCTILNELLPGGAPHQDAIRHVTDRPGHDHRYAIDPSHAETELGWRATTTLSDGLRRTVTWYLNHPGWVTDVLGADADLPRLGLTPEQPGGTA